MSSTAGRTSPQLSKFKISRRGRKLLVSDDQRMLVALPKDVPERTWAEVLMKEENDLVCFDIREEIIEAAMTICYDKYMEKQTALFTVHCAVQAWMKLIDWYFYRHDPGEEPTAYPPAYIPHRPDSWLADDQPAPSPKDTWARQALMVVEEIPDETECRVTSEESLDLPLVDDIPKEYWFPGKVQLRMEEEELEDELSEEGTKKYRRKKPQSGRDPWEYPESLSSADSSRALLADSEVLQRVTDYSGDTDTLKESGQDGSLRGAGDSRVCVAPRVRRSAGKFHKSRISGLGKPSVPGSRGRVVSGGGPLDGGDSRSRLSLISDCRLRNLRLDTQYEISSERMDTPPIDAILKRK